MSRPDELDMVHIPSHRNPIKLKTKTEVEADDWNLYLSGITKVTNSKKK